MTKKQTKQKRQERKPLNYRWKTSTTILKKVTAIMLTTSMVLSPFSSLAVKADETTRDAKHDNPWDYTIYADTVTLDGEGTVDVQGDIYDPSENIILPHIYYSILALEEDMAREKIEEGEEVEDHLRTSIISKEDIIIDLGDTPPAENKYYTKKAGAFGAGFLTEMYENPEKWNSILPAFDKGINIADAEDGKKDIKDIVDSGYFAAVQESAVDASKYTGYEKLPKDIFMSNLNNQYVAEYIDSLLENHSVFDTCSSEKADNQENTTSEATETAITTIQAGWDKTTINPTVAKNAEKIRITGGNLTLDGAYPELKEVKIDSYGGTQLLGTYENLEYIYMTTYANLNLAGEFPALRGVYMPGGQLLLGTDKEGFKTEWADIINENGSITIYTAKDTDITGSTIATKGKIAVRGARKDPEASTYKAEYALIAAGNTITLGDINDDNKEVWDEVPCYISQSGISIVNSKAEKLQGLFLSRNGKMILSGSDIKALRGYIFSQKGIDGENKTATEGVYVETTGFNKSAGLSNENYQPTGKTLGGIKKIEYAMLPVRITEIPGMTEFLTEAVEIKNEEGINEERYEYGLRWDEENTIYIRGKCKYIRKNLWQSCRNGRR